MRAGWVGNAGPLGCRNGRCPRGSVPVRVVGVVSRWLSPFTYLKIKNPSLHVSCTSGSICLYNRGSSRGVEINKHRETNAQNLQAQELAGWRS